MKLKKEYVQVLKSTKDWEEAIHMASVPLINDSIINENYIHKMISNIKDMGPYVVISQDIALPHARPEDGAFESAISILKLEDRVSFGKDKNVNIIIVLACSNNSDHLDTLKYISTLLSNESNYKKLIESKSAEAIYDLFTERG